MSTGIGEAHLGGEIKCFDCGIIWKAATLYLLTFYRI